MTKNIYVWFKYTKQSGSCASKIEWTGTMNIQKAINIADKISSKYILQKQLCKFFKHDVELSISIQEIETGNVLYKRSVLN